MSLEQWLNRFGTSYRQPVETPLMQESIAIRRPGISSSTLEEAGIRRLDEKEAFALCGRTESGIYIPFRDLMGQPIGDTSGTFGRLRLDRPKGKKRYHQRFKTGIHAYLPAHLRNVESGGDLIVVEGEFKALSLCEVGFPTLGLPGLYATASHGEEIEIISELQAAIEHIRPGRILYTGDRDTCLNWQFADAVMQFARLVNLPIVCPRIPLNAPGKGIDDCRDKLGNNFEVWFREIIEDAVAVDMEGGRGRLMLANLERERQAVSRLAGDDRAKAGRRLVTMAARLNKDPVSAGEIKMFAFKTLEIPKRDFDRAVKVDAEEIEKRREPNLAEGTQSGKQVLFEEVDPWPTPVDGGVLLTNISDVVREYVILPEGAADAEALWVLFTYAHDAFVTSPILAIVSPVMRCGKTTHLRVLASLVNKPLPASNITTAALFRSIELWTPTLLVDELDTFIHKSDDLRGVLNSGHQKETAYITRCVGDDNEPRNFRTWAPKAMAMIGKMHPTLTDRSITIPMARKLPGGRVTRLRRQESATILELKRKCARWAKDHKAALIKEEPDLPAELNDRAKDNWEPLLAIANQAGGNWPQRALTSIRTLVRDEIENESYSIILLEDIEALFEQRGGSFLSSAEIVKALGEMEERPWPEFRRGKTITTRQLAGLLRPFDIKPKQKRDGKDVIRGYTIGSFTDVFTRYLTAGSVTPLQTASEAASSVVRSATDSIYVTDAIRSEPAYQAGCNAVTDETKETNRI